MWIGRGNLMPAPAQQGGGMGFAQDKTISLSTQSFQLSLLTRGYRSIGVLVQQLVVT